MQEILEIESCLGTTFSGPGAGTFLAFAFVWLFLVFVSADATGSAKLVNLANSVAAAVAFGLAAEVKR